jgi:hypothetical protein
MREIELEAADSNRYRIVNGKKEKDLRIFEGDILKNEFGLVGVVYWHKETAGFYAGGGVSLIHTDEFEIIGNQFDSPEPVIQREGIDSRYAEVV